jgi:uncharacterized protein
MQRFKIQVRAGLSAIFIGLSSAMVPAAEPGKPLSVLFLGDGGHHQPAERARQLIPVMAGRGIDITYTERLADLNPANLATHDALIVYANIERIEPSEEQALLDYVAGGGGFAALHCASYCFLNSPRYVALVGAQFQRHGSGEFATNVAEPNHPIMRGLAPFRTWDETYVHHQHNAEGRTLLQTRSEGNSEEPWTWARNHGRGRVFYTAYGHDARTWSNPGFQALVERGIRWAAGKGGVFDSTARPPRDLKPFSYTAAVLPNYLPGKGWGTLGEPINQMQLPLEPAESQRHIQVPHGFRAQLFAAEPEITKPIAMAWDHRGRLWIAESVDYPNELRPAGEGRDRIKICEDTDGDGRADKFTVFAEKLSIPTSLTPVRGGVVVHQAPQTLLLRDTNGDDREDERQVLLSGWDTGDTHAGPSNLRWGFDNWLYGMVGYSGFKGQVGGEQLGFRTGFFRFRPDGSKLEFLRNTNNNSWGVGFSEEGLLFGSTANGNPSVYLPISNRYYEAVRGWSGSVLGNTAFDARIYPVSDKVRQVDNHGSFTAAAGHALYTARAFPPEYWNRTAFVSEPTGHLTATFLLEPRGSDFVSYNSWNLLASDDEWTSPISAEVGPDGQLWVIDWYNYIIQHNPIPAGFKGGKHGAYETELRDKTHGRIYRIVYSGSKPYRPIQLDPNNAQQLVAALQNDNLFWRLTAQRLLVERGNHDVLPALAALVEDRSVDAIGLNPGAIHALWSMHGLGLLDGNHPTANAAAQAALAHPSAGVRRAALGTLARAPESTTALLSHDLLADGDAQVRLAAFLALAEMPADAKAARAIASALALPANLQDRWIPDAATSAAARHDLALLEFVAARQSDQPLDPRFAEVIARVAEHYARGAPADSVERLVVALSQGEGPTANAILDGLARGWPRDRTVPFSTAGEQALAGLFPRCSAAAQSQLLQLTARWGSHGLEKHAATIAGSLLATARDEASPDEARRDAARQLVEFRRQDADVVKSLLVLITVRTSPELAAALIGAVSRSESAEVGGALVAGLGAMTPAVRPSAIKALLGRGDWTEDLVEALEKGQVQLGELSLDQKQALTAHPDATIARRASTLLASGGGLPNPDRQRVIDELAPLVLRKADAVRGQAVFKAQCSKCHTHGGEGNKIGPDLTGMAVHPKAELLLNILDPSRSVEGNFRVYSIVTDEGRVLSGLLVADTKTAVAILDAEGKQQTVLRENIEQFTASTKSLMPDGFEKQVSPDDVANLLEFLTGRGKFLPLDLRTAATIVSTKGMFYGEEADAERLIFPDWSPKTFEGIPFQLVDPQGDRVPNVVLLYGPAGKFPPRMPKAVTLPCNMPAKAIHLLSGVSGWGANGSPVVPTVSLIVRLHYAAAEQGAAGPTEDHELQNGVHFADYIRQVDVPGSRLAFKLRDQQIRYLAIHPRRAEPISSIELVKGPDGTAPLVMAVTVETRD